MPSLSAAVAIAGVVGVAGLPCWNTTEHWSTLNPTAAGYVAGVAVDNDLARLLFSDQDGGLVAVSAYDNSVAWRNSDSAFDSSSSYDLMTFDSNLSSGPAFLVGGYSWADSTTHIKSLAPASGETLWHIDTLGAGLSPWFAYSKGLLLASGKTDVRAIDASNGAELWTLPISRGDEYSWYTDGVAVSGNIVVHGVEEGSFKTNGNFSALDASSGKVIWTKAGSARLGLEIAEREDKKFVIAALDMRQQDWPASKNSGSRIVVMDAISGKELWHKDNPDSNGADFTLLPCGLLHTSWGVMRPEDGSVQWSPSGRLATARPSEKFSSFAEGARRARGATTGSVPLFLENNAAVARDCESGTELWRAPLPNNRYGYPQSWQTLVTLDLPKPVSGCRPDVAAFYFSERSEAGGADFFSGAAAVPKDEVIVV